MTARETVYAPAGLGTGGVQPAVTRLHQAPQTQDAQEVTATTVR
jgi:hypothetical protein